MWLVRDKGGVVDGSCENFRIRVIEYEYVCDMAPPTSG